MIGDCVTQTLTEEIRSKLGFIEVGLHGNGLARSSPLVPDFFSPISGLLR